MDVDTALRAAGLNGNEARVYVACLRLGEATAGAIAGESGVQRSIVYRYLAELCRKGLVAKVVKNGVAQFTALGPDRLSTLLSERQNQLEAALPALEKLHGQAPAAMDLALIEGWDGVRMVFNDSLKLKRGEEVCAAAFNLDYLAEFGEYFDRLNKRRDKLGIKFRVIYGDSPEARKRIAFHKPLRTATTRIYPKAIPGASLTLLFPRQACLIDFAGRKPNGIIIRNASVKTALQEAFESLWRESRPAK